MPSPHTPIPNSQTLGQMVRQRRLHLALTQRRAAALCGVGTRFLSELENGKETLELGKTLLVLKNLGLQLNLQPRACTPINIDPPTQGNALGLNTQTLAKQRTQTC